MSVKNIECINSFSALDSHNEGKITKKFLIKAYTKLYPQNTELI